MIELEKMNAVIDELESLSENLNSYNDINKTLIESSATLAGHKETLEKINAGIQNEINALEKIRSEFSLENDIRNQQIVELIDKNLTLLNKILMANAESLAQYKSYTDSRLSALKEDMEKYFDGKFDFAGSRLEAINASIEIAEGDRKKHNEWIKKRVNVLMVLAGLILLGCIVSFFI